LDLRLSGAQSRYGSCEEGKTLLPLPVIEPWFFGSPACRLSQYQLSYSGPYSEVLHGNIFYVLPLFNFSFPNLICVIIVWTVKWLSPWVNAFRVANMDSCEIWFRAKHQFESELRDRGTDVTLLLSISHFWRKLRLSYATRISWFYSTIPAQFGDIRVPWHKPYKFHSKPFQFLSYMDSVAPV
jgi:hypothetical protein